MGTVHERITSNPNVMLGKPCIKGTRIPVYLVLRVLADPQGFDQVFEAYPRLTPEDVQAALRFAADWMELEEISFGNTEAA